MPKINKFIILNIFVTLFKCTNVYSLNVTIPQDLKNNISISITDTSNGKPVFNYNSSTPMLIASNMKVITSYAALKSFSPDFRYSTKLGYTGKISNNELNGDLFIIGAGDPTLNTDNLYLMIESLNKLGIKHINGNIIYDGSIFNQNVTSSELYPEPFAAYSVNPAGLIINSNLSNITIKVNNNTISLSPDFKSKYKMINKLVLTSQKMSCQDPSNYITINNSGKNLQFSGSVPKTCNNKKLPIYVLDNDNFNKQILKRIIKNQNITFNGIIESGITPENYRLITQNYSPTLADIIKQMNQQSNNLYAKTLLLSLGAYKSNNQNTYADGKQVYLSNLANKFDFIELAAGLENGAGLSRTEKITTSHITGLLNTVYNSTESQLLIQSLPTPGKDGTLQREFPEFANQLYAKTGSLSDTKAYSGYFFSKTGKAYNISLVANNINATTNSQSQLMEFKQLVSNILGQLQ